jgi:choline dehydrogenase-like flavoprotein
MAESQIFDVIIIGSGFGGATVAHVLKDTGVAVLILERGDFLKQEKENWDVAKVSLNRRYDSEDTWYDRTGKPFQPRIYYYVGGNSKVFGGAAFRLREQDFASRIHEGGSTITWPITYAELKPYYDRAELLLEVHGKKGQDPTEPPGDEFPFPPIPHEPVIEELAAKLRKQGLHPFHLPLAIDLGPGGRCQKGSPCDGFPCMVRAKGDAENRLLRPMLLKKTSNVTLWTNSFVTRLETTEDGARVARVCVLREGKEVLVSGKLFVLAAGAVNSAVLLLISKNDRHPKGLANSSGLVGRNFMSHHCTVLLAVHPWKKNPTRFQKTLAVNDFYNSGSDAGKPLGNIQLRGKIKPEMLRVRRNLLLRLFSRAIAERSVDLWIMTEDLLDPENRVEVGEKGRIRLIRRPSNWRAHEQLVQKAKEMMRRAGYPICIVDSRGITAVQHQCGTIRFGNDRKTAVLDTWCRAFDVSNLYVVDASFFPTSGAVNPSLTIVAQALRAAEHIRDQILS